jgi:hypothetical protein
VDEYTTSADPSRRVTREGPGFFGGTGPTSLQPLTASPRCRRKCLPRLRVPAGATKRGSAVLDVWQASMAIVLGVDAPPGHIIVDVGSVAALGAV